MYIMYKEHNSVAQTPDQVLTGSLREKVRPVKSIIVSTVQMPTVTGHDAALLLGLIRSGD